MPTSLQPQHEPSKSQDATRVFVVSSPPKVVTLPSHHQWPHAAHQGLIMLIFSMTSQISKQGEKTPQSFRYCLLKASPLSTDGTRLPCRARNLHLGVVRFMVSPSADSPLVLPHDFYLDHSPLLRHTRPGVSSPMSSDQTRPPKSQAFGRRSSSCVSIDL